MKSTKDMTVGSPMKLILGFSLPLLFGFLFQQFYSVVDTIIVGRILGINALAGVGATGSINFMVIGFCMGVCSGFAIPVAHKFGAKDYSGMLGSAPGWPGAASNIPPSPSRFPPAHGRGRGPPRWRSRAPWSCRTE